MHRFHRRTIGRALVIGLGALFLIAAAGCDQGSEPQPTEGPAERMGKELDAAMQKAGERADAAMSEAQQRIDRSLQTAGEKLDNAVEETKAGLGTAADRAADGLKAAGQRLGGSEESHTDNAPDSN